MDLVNGPFWVVDVEGNGGNPPEIVELAMVEVSGLVVTGRQRHWLIKPEQSITPAVTRIHGLTDADVAQSPSMDDIADDVLPWIEEAPIIGHNVRVEVDLLRRALPAWAPRIAIDTLKLARALKPELEAYGLEKLGVLLGLDREAAERTGRRHHSALYDATLTALIFVQLLQGVPPAKRDSFLRDADIFDQKQGSLL